MSEHRREARVEGLSFGLLVTSDAVYEGRKRDEATPLVRGELEKRGYRLAAALIAPNNIYAIMRDVLVLVTRDDVDVVLVTGGTGPRPRDVTIDALERIADRRLPGYGEEFRRRSFSEVGANALLSRAEAYIIAGKPVFATPGSPSAIRTALSIIFELVGHLVYELRR